MGGIASSIEIRTATPADTEALLGVEREAFGGSSEAELVVGLMSSSAYIPELSLVADNDGLIVGHVLFTRAYAGGVPAVLLAPLAVVPAYRHCGIGGELVRAGLGTALSGGFQLSLVLGHPEYYPRFGYEPAEPYGILPPYPVTPPEAWMVLEMGMGARERAAGTVQVADELMLPEMWRT
ncbi:MAG: N-acetyltransferase [Actinobacteria bacterium]|nr:N-acetyltransferase [Actinomycetota bacterium]MCG2808262.1 N-acetyltransferase [Coriobacteriia bacterium]